MLSTADGSLLDTFDLAGQLALDPVHNWLIVDQGEEGLAVLDALTGILLHTISLPPLPPFVQSPPPPQFDPTTDMVYAMRQHVVYAVDAKAGTFKPLAQFDLRPQDNCREPHDALLPISDARYDSARRILYLDFVSYFCIPWIGFTTVIYDVAAQAEVGREGGSSMQGVVWDGRYVYTSWHRFGIGTLRAVQDGRAWNDSTDWSGGRLGGIQVDPARNHLYWGTQSSLRVFDAGTMRQLMMIPLPRPGWLAGFDSVTDQLILLADDGLQLLPLADVRPPGPALSPARPLPNQPVTQLVVSPAWPEDGTVLGIWGALQPADDCYVFGQSGGTIHRSTDRGASWHQLRAGLPPRCELSAALALSPSYATDSSLLAGMAGNGIFRSDDGGLLWEPANWGLASMGVEQLLISPGFSQDQTAFARVRTGPLQRTLDGENSWQGLSITPGLVAMSPEFDRDRTLIAAVQAVEPLGLFISRDGGDRWQFTAELPQSESLVMLSAAPLYAKWEVLFAYSSTGRLLRSADGGKSWQQVLVSDLTGARAQIAYAPGIEINRPVFLVVTGYLFNAQPGEVMGKLFRSLDGGLNWQELDLGSGIVPTALAISPDFPRDRLIFIGTADGQVLVDQG